MRKYVKPAVEINEATVSLPLLMSTHDEIGDGQLTNYGNFDDSDNLSSFTNIKVWGDDADDDKKW